MAHCRSFLVLVTTANRFHVNGYIAQVVDHLPRFRKGHRFESSCPLNFQDLFVTCYGAA